MAVSGVILAAGASSRLGRPKQLLTLDGEPVIHVVARNALRAELGEVIVVTGGSGADVAAAVRDLPVRVVANPDYLLGQSTSLVAGLEVVSADATGVVFLLGDQPEVDATIIDALVAEFMRTGGPIVQPVYRATPSNPVLFDRSLFGELLAVTGDEGARSVIQRHRSEIVRVPFPERELPGDLDTEADYVAMATRWAMRRAEQA